MDGNQFLPNSTHCTLKAFIFFCALYPGADPSESVTLIYSERKYLSSKTEFLHDVAVSVEPPLSPDPSALLEMFTNVFNRNFNCK